MANPVPRTEAGRALMNELGLAGKPIERLLREQICAIEAEARQQMKAEVREQIFRDNGLIADPLAAASPAAPAVDVERLAQAMCIGGYPNRIGESRDGVCHSHRKQAAQIADEYASLQDTVDGSKSGAASDPVASTGGEK